MDKRTDCLTIKEFAEKVNYSERAIRQMCIDKKITATKLPEGRKWLIPQEALIEFQRNTKSKPEKKTDDEHRTIYISNLGSKDIQAATIHLDSIREYILKLKGAVFTPTIEEGITISEHPIKEIQNESLFNYLTSHIPSPPLWNNYVYWSDRIHFFIDACHELFKFVIRNHYFSGDYKTESGCKVWFSLIGRDYWKPILHTLSRNASNERYSQLTKADYNFRFDDPITEDKFGNEKSTINEENILSKNYIKRYLMYVDSIPIAYCLDTENAKKTYLKASEYILNYTDTLYTIQMFRELKLLEGKIQKNLDDIIDHQDYRWYTCDSCKKYNVPDLTKQRWPQSEGKKFYDSVLAEHYRVLADSAIELSYRLRAFLIFREKWIDMGVPKIEGNIIDGCCVTEPYIKDAIPFSHYDLPYTLDRRPLVHIVKPFDSLLAVCLLEHFNQQYSTRAHYRDWREIDFVNFHPSLIRKICSWLENPKFNDTQCYVCWRLKEIYSPSKSKS